jgi:hypothetical protein
VDVTGSYADALCGGLLSIFSLVAFYLLSCEWYTRTFPHTYWDYFGSKYGEFDVNYFLREGYTR